ATHYHANYVAPYWGHTLAKVVQIGAHIFYRWPGGSGEPGAFGYRYAGGEAPPAGVPAAAPVELAAAASDGPPEPHAPDDVGGRVVLGLGWTPKPPPPSTDALASILAQQGGQPAPAAHHAAASTGNAGG
ncbi:MAG TPA: hypothetical protein VG939_13395, partial [Caulobacteraceae bacterium]|nr:hypothetical protein [Caulobacteraceae bacterium]